MPEKSKGKNDRARVWRAIDATIRRGVDDYRREAVLPALLAVAPQELADYSPDNTERLCLRLAAALRRERGRGCAGHWTYDINRHLGLLQAYRAERARLGRPRRDRPGDGSRLAPHQLPRFRQPQIPIPSDLDLSAKT